MKFLDFFKSILPPSFLSSKMAIMTGAYSALGRQFDDLEAAIIDGQNQLFIDSATWKLPVYEAEFGIKLTDTTVSDSARRNNVMAMSRGGLGATPAALKSVLQSYGYATNIAENYAGYTFTIQFIDTRGIPPNIGDLQALMTRFVPAHLQLQWQFIYTQYRELTSFTYGQMSARTYEYLTTQLP